MGQGIFDLGWTGFVHRTGISSDATLTVRVDTCRACVSAGPYTGMGCTVDGDCPIGTCAGATTIPCGRCTFVGPVANVEADWGRIHNHRCATATWTRCVHDDDCPGGDTCAWYFGAPVSFSAGGTPACDVNRIVGPIQGAADLNTGVATFTLALDAALFTGLSESHPCPSCEGDSAPNDGTLDGTCSGGTRDGQACDANAISNVSGLFGQMSLDCPPSSGSAIGTIALSHLVVATEPTTWTLTTDQMLCRANGWTSAWCFCDTCNNTAATPCNSNAECTAVGATVCGGKRCITGANNGASCSVASQCPGVGAVCGRSGVATAPNACLDDTSVAGDGTLCTAVAPVESQRGECVEGPFDKTCQPGAEFYTCGDDADCAAYPGTTCHTQARACYRTSGVVGDAVTVPASHDPVTGPAIGVQLGALFCLGTTSSSAVNTVAGLPGLGRMTMGATMRALPPPDRTLLQGGGTAGGTTVGGP